MEAEDGKQPLSYYERERRQTRAIWLGLFAALGTGALLMLLAYIIESRREDILGNWIWSVFTVVPFSMGFVGAFIWQNGGLKRRFIVNMGLLLLVLGMGIAVFFLHEGVICLVIASPLLGLFLWLGLLAGIHVAKASDNRLRVSVLPLLAALVIIDALSPHHYTNAVTDTVTIHAPVAKVWPMLAGYPAICEKPDYWLWRIGLPCPVQSVAKGADIGAARECRFTEGVTIGERITKVVPGERLAFDITRQPNNPEIMGHFVLKRGEFLLHDNGNGTCTLSGTSWYTLNVYPSWYYDLWTRDIVRHVHLRVMRHIRALAETG